MLKNNEPIPEERAGREATGTKGIYIASRASLPERAQRWRQIRDSGVPISCSWIDEAGEGETDDFGELWMRIQTEIFGSRSLVLYAEAGDFPLKGALIEVGIALAVGIPVFAVLPGVELDGRTMRPVGSWLQHPQVQRVGTVASAIARSMELAAQPSVQRNSNDWIEIIDGVRWPTGEDHLLVVRGPEETQMQCVGYWNRLMKTWLVNGERHDGLDVTHYKLLDWPSITAERGSK